MRRGLLLRGLFVALAIGTGSFAANTATAQVPQIEPPWTGTLPPAAGGIALLVASRDVSATDLIRRLQDEGCNVVSAGITTGGRWQMLIPGAPAFVNAGFPQAFATGTPFAVRCAASEQPLTLAEADEGRSVRLDVHGRLRVSLPANPSTGFSWRVDPALPATVLTQIGEPTFTPDSPLIGASGVMTLEFSASGPGLVTLRLIYDRPWETVPPLEEWTVTVIVDGQQPVALLGEVRTQPAAAPGARYLELRQPGLPEGAVPRGVGIRASDGATANALDALVDTGTEALVWGELTCGVVDYGDCRIDATTIVLAMSTVALPPAPVAGWAGTVRALPGSTSDYFELAGGLPIQYGIAGATPAVEAQLTEARETGQRIRIWGELRPLQPDVNRVRIVVTEVALAPR